MLENYFFSFFKNVFKKSLPIIKCKYLCAVSGGQDSMFLFFFFLHLRFLWKIELSILYNNHLWQQNNFYSFRENYKIVYLFQIPFNLSINGVKNRNEAVARNWRQDSLNRISFFENTKEILVGHTATDFMETGFFNLLRGSSPQGICSLKKRKKIKLSIYNIFFSSRYSHKKKIRKKKLKSQKILFFKKKDQKLKTIINYKYSFVFKEKNLDLKKNYINISFLKLNSFVFERKLKFYNIYFRPLIPLHRNDIIKLSNYYSIPNTCDFSNNSILFSRNIIRHKVFVFFRKFFNHNFDLKFYQYLQILADEHQFFHLFYTKSFKNLSKKQLSLIPKSIQRRFIYIILTIYLESNLNFFHIETIRMKIF
jgi:tRNA(Ile)-lysidine synthase TilS/MesJ|uniref:tRNA(Ile)-lysidine synthase n=1 Tax=Prototheca lentecrescens TaxID=2836214 RepID=UPI0030011D1C